MSVKWNIKPDTDPETVYTEVHKFLYAQYKN
jgi:hypothetical protein